MGDGGCFCGISVEPFCEDFPCAAAGFFVEEGDPAVDAAELFPVGGFALVDSLDLFAGEGFYAAFPDVFGDDHGDGVFANSEGGEIYVGVFFVVFVVEWAGGHGELDSALAEGGDAAGAAALGIDLDGEAFFFSEDFSSFCDDGVYGGGSVDADGFCVCGAGDGEGCGKEAEVHGVDGVW